MKLVASTEAKSHLRCGNEKLKLTCKVDAQQQTFRDTLSLVRSSPYTSGEREREVEIDL